MSLGSGRETEWNEHIRNADRAQRDGKYDYAEAMWTLAVEESESFGRADRRLAYSLEKLTECLWFQGRLQEALEYGSRALTIYEQALGAGHIDVGSMAYNLAMVHHMLNSFDEAERLYKRALAVKTSALGAKHPDVVKVLGSFADLLNKLGRMDEARQLRATERMVTAANWSQTDAGRDIGAQQGLSTSDSARLTASVSYPPGVLQNPSPGAMSAQALQTIAPPTGMAPPLQSMAPPLQGMAPPLPQGMAPPLPQGSAPQTATSPLPPGTTPPQGMTPPLPSAGPTTAAPPPPPPKLSPPAQGQGSSGSVLTRLQAIKNAAKIQTSTGNIPIEPAQQAAFEQQQAAVQSTQTQAPADSKPKSKEQAPQKTNQEFAQAAAKLAASISGSFGNSWDEIKETAEQSLNLEDYQKAEASWRECLTLARGDNENNPCYCFVLEKLGEIYIRKQEYNEAEDCLRTSYNIKTSVLGDAHPAVASALNNLARLYFTSNDYFNAEYYGDESVKLNEKLFGPNSIEVASALHNLATVYHVQRKYEKAELHYERAMKLKQLLLGGDHPETVKLLKAYANLLRSTHREEQADHLDQCITGMISGRWRVMKTPESEEGWWKQEIFGQE